MTYNRDVVESEVMEFINDLIVDWDYSGEVNGSTLLFSELGFDSLDIVVFATAIQKRYQKTMPFAELFSELGQRDEPDLSISELIDFVSLHVTENEIQAAAI